MVHGFFFVITDQVLLDDVIILFPEIRCAFHNVTIRMMRRVEYWHDAMILIYEESIFVNYCLL